MLRGDDAFPMASQHENGALDGLNGDRDGDDTYCANDDLDDVFGSAPPSPTTRTAGDQPPHHRESEGYGYAELSDIPRLRKKHGTEGYRDGVTAGKGQSVQAGFDEGYSLGAVLGLRVGRIVGVLEGVLESVAMGDGRGWEGYGERLEGLVGEAKRELGTESVFGRQWWGEDGIWKFEVPGEGEGEVVFGDVAAAHPLVRKWEGLVAAEVRTWGLDLGVLDGERDTEDIAVEDVGSKHEVTVSKEIPSDLLPSSAKIMGVSKRDLNW